MNKTNFLDINELPKGKIKFLPFEMNYNVIAERYLELHKNRLTNFKDSYDREIQINFQERKKNKIDLPESYNQNNNKI